MPSAERRALRRKQLGAKRLRASTFTFRPSVLLDVFLRRFYLTSRYNKHTYYI